MILGVEQSDLERGYGKQRERAEEFERFMKVEVEQEGWTKRSRAVGLDGRCEVPSPARFYITVVE